MSDYAADAVLHYRRSSARRERDSSIFKRRFDEFAKPGVFLAPKLRAVEGDYVYTVFTAEIQDNAYELASDTFVIQNGTIKMEGFTAKNRSKSEGIHHD